MKLSVRDFDTLQRAILELHGHLDFENFHASLPTIFMKAIPCDYFSVMDYDFDPVNMRFRAIGMLESHHRMNSDHMARVEQYGAEHRITQHSPRSKKPNAGKFPDFFAAGQVHGSEPCGELHRQDIGHVLGVISFATRYIAAINLARRPHTPDFSDRDRMVLNLLLPHFEQARCQAEERSGQNGANWRSLESHSLSPREAEVARWLAEGKTNAEIGTILHLSVRTVEKHVERILMKLSVENRTTAATLLRSASHSAGPDREQHGVPEGRP